MKTVSQYPHYDKQKKHRKLSLTYLRTFQIVGLSIVTKEHYILLQITQAPVLVAAHSLLQIYHSMFQEL